MENDDNRGDKKSAREEFENFESEANSVPFLKLSRVDSSEFTRVESALDYVDVQLPESKHIQEDLLNFLDDSDPVIGPGLGIQGLDSVLKSFEEEIVVPAQATLPVTSLETRKSKPDLGFLLEASDDELGLPPSFSSVEQGVDIEGSVELGADGIEEMMGYEFPIPSYGSFDFGIGGDSDADNKNHSNSGDFVALGGLFEPIVEISELTS
ncbi:hypothetical protein E1A91_A09G189000v1 [Gossypium mustelinum]|uniref:Uncharacterized protein n=1 Tax=Gossypium mustelinum TaxID=34275 RepID=A0A5D2Y0C9_GOSMU|nr:hypothetical protein E1A91_A09G189000v1 [Gossypium mustelinum]